MAAQREQQVGLFLRLDTLGDDPHAQRLRQIEDQSDDGYMPLAVEIRHQKLPVKLQHIHRKLIAKTLFFLFFQQLAATFVYVKIIT